MGIQFGIKILTAINNFQGNFLSNEAIECSNFVKHCIQKCERQVSSVFGLLANREVVNIFKRPSREMADQRSDSSDGALKKGTSLPKSRLKR